MYSLAGYASMLADPVRTGAYAQALSRAIRPTSTAVDLGSGSGIFALLACLYGARHVYAIEREDVIEMARSIADANGYAGRITFIQRDFKDVVLPERADVIVSDLHGALPLFENHLPWIAHAREHWLAAGGVLIPRKETLWASIVEAPEFYNQIVAPWSENAYGFDMRAGLQLATSTAYKLQAAPGQLLGAPQCWAALDYMDVNNPDVSADMTWTVARTGVAHGLLVWFDTDLAEGVHFSNAPAAPETIYSSGFFPLTSAIALEPGDLVSVRFSAKLSGGRYVWRWNTRVQTPAQQTKADFAQSTFSGVFRSRERFRKRADDYTSALTEDGEIDQFILDRMRNHLALGDIARQLAAQFPQRFPKWQDALGRVGKLSVKYCR